MLLPKQIAAMPVEANMVVTLPARFGLAVMSEHGLARHYAARYGGRAESNSTGQVPGEQTRLMGCRHVKVLPAKQESMGSSLIIRHSSEARSALHIHGFCLAIEPRAARESLVRVALV